MTTVALVHGAHHVRQAWALPAARARLGGDAPVLLPGSHLPLVSRPAHLAEVLAGLAAR